MSTFTSLSALRSAIAGQRTDLGKIRSLTAELNKKVASASNQTQFRPDYIAQQVGMLRQEYQAKATQYLDSRGTTASFQNCKVQLEHWSVPAFLSRSPGAPTEVAGLLRVISLQLSSQRMPTASLAALADHAVMTRDWPSLGVAYNELAHRALTNGEAEAHQRMLDEAEIPECVEAKNLIEQSKQNEEFLAYSLKALSSGGDDLGIAMEASIAAGNETDAARARAMMAEEIARQNAIAEWQRAS